MGIVYFSEENRFILSTKTSTYVFEIAPTGELRHLHYGAPRDSYAAEPMRAVSFAPYREEHSLVWSSDILSHEFSVYGNGDFRANAAAFAGKDGTGICRFAYEGHRIFPGKPSIDPLPMARAAEDTETLEILLYDPVLCGRVHLFYTVYPREDVITRYWQLENCGDDHITVTRAMSLCMDMERCDLELLSFFGEYHREMMGEERFPLHHGSQVFSSRRGCSSHHRNPFFALCEKEADEEKGAVWGFNLLWSGSYQNEIEVDGRGHTRLLSGLGGEHFAYTLQANERFTAPEAIMTYSATGIGGMTRNFHSFIRKYILPPHSLTKPHPVVLNTWEACYFQIDHELLCRFAEEAAALGFDMLVMDDGWFGQRHNDAAGLGDWVPNDRKFPEGLAAFAHKIRNTGVKFGIWIEPEMVNPDSELYRAHPDWCLRAPSHAPLHSRKQLVLDLCNPQVFDYLTDIFSKAFDGVEIDYFKWDMNRNLSDPASPYLSPAQQGEVEYRYMLGVYRLLSWFRRHFPNAVIETCSGGGGRYDAGMMCYGMQIWTSDNTNPRDRVLIQNAALTAYPPNTMSCHVSNPQDSLASLDYRYKVAVAGMLGYELHILNMSEEIKQEIAVEIAHYRQFEHLIREGDYHRLSSPRGTPYAAYYYISEGADQILLSLIRQDKSPAKPPVLAVKEAKTSATYTDRLSGIQYTGHDLQKGISLPSSAGEYEAHLLYLVEETPCPAGE